MKNVFTKETTNELIARIEKLTPIGNPVWGKMNVAQMLAHCNVTYEMVYDNTHKAPNGFIKLILKIFVKDVVVGDRPYKRNGQTSPAFLIKSEKDFGKEKARLNAFIIRTQELGEDHFEGKKSLSFGKLSKAQWNNMFYKHLDHHLNQFGV